MPFKAAIQSDEETLYGIAGTLTWTIDGKAIEVGPGQAVCIPRGGVHRFDNFCSVDAKQLSIVTPAVLGPTYFREASAVINATGGAPDPVKMMEIYRRHGMAIASLPTPRQSQALSD